MRPELRHSPKPMADVVFRLLTRRAWMAGLVASTAFASTASAGGQPVRAWAGAYRILIVGSSMIGGGFGLYLEQALRDRGQEVLRHGKASTGLARPDFHDWNRKATELVQTFKPDVSLVMFGGNDVQGLHMGKKGHWIRWPEAGWDREYARRVAAFARILAPEAQHIFWVGMPIMRTRAFTARMRRINTIYRAEMAIRPNSWFVDTWRTLADENGAYAAKIPVGEPNAAGRRRKATVRGPDGIHVTPVGAHVLKDHVLQAMAKTLSLARG